MDKWNNITMQQFKLLNMAECSIVCQTKVSPEIISVLKPFWAKWERWGHSAESAIGKMESWNQICWFQYCSRFGFRSLKGTLFLKVCYCLPKMTKWALNGYRGDKVWNWSNKMVCEGAFHFPYQAQNRPVILEFWF